MKKTIVSLLLIFTAFASQAQQRSIKKPALELVKFFAGEGQFSNGKPIAAELYFKANLDSTWLEHTHLDKAPNTYRDNA